MAAVIVTKKTVEDLFDEASRTMDREAAVLQVAGLTGHDVVTIEGVLASRESRQEMQC